MITRRDFAIRTAGTLGALAVSPAAAFADQLNAAVALSNRLDHELTELGDAAAPELMADDEKFWRRVRSAYTLNPDVVNLDHGWTNPTTRAAVEELVRGARRLQALPAEELGRLFFGSPSTGVRPALAEAMGVPPAEIALVRNATEALNTVLLGLPLSAGDEIVCSAHDYFAMLDALEQRRARDGVVLRMIRPPIPASSLKGLAELYEAALGPRTRLCWSRTRVTSPGSCFLSSVSPPRRTEWAPRWSLTVRRPSECRMTQSLHSIATTTEPAPTNGSARPWD